MDKIYSFKELKESKLIYDRKPPRFGIIMTTITSILLIFIILLACFTTKESVVKVSGIVTNENKINIMNEVSGSIKKINFKDGDNIKVDDVILEIDTFQVDIQIQQLQSSYDYLQTKIDLLEKLIFFINNYKLNDMNTQKNPFNNNVADEVKLYSDAKSFIDYVDSQLKVAEEPDADKFEQSDVDSLKSQFLSQQYTTLDQYKLEQVNNKSNIKMYQESKLSYKVVSTIAGKVSFNNDLSIGTVIQAGSLLGTVSSGDNSSTYIDSILSATDISKIKVGSKVEIAISGIIQSDYGIVKGEISHIGSDSIQTENGQVLYRVKIKLNDYKLKNKSGNEIVIVNGMVAESRIKYNQTKWIIWAVEQMGIKL